MNVKKNWFMRIGVLSICLVLISCVLVGGTFAKYIGSASGTATARVGYFSFEKDTTATNNFELFKTADAEVSAANSDTIIVPGTYGSLGMKLKGMAETDVNFTYTLNETNVDDIPIVYEVMDGSTPYYYSDKLSGTVSLNKTEGGTAFTSVLISGNLAAMATKLADLNSIVKAGTNYATLAGNSSNIKWFWAFENNSAASDATPSQVASALAGRDGYDTTLGNVAYNASGSAAAERVNANAAKVTLAVTITATQVD